MKQFANEKLPKEFPVPRESSNGSSNNVVSLRTSIKSGKSELNASGQLAARRSQRYPFDHRASQKVGNKSTLPARSSQSAFLLLQVLRLLIVGVGISVIAGSLLAAWNSAGRATGRATGGTSNTALQQVGGIQRTGGSSSLALTELKLSQEITSLKQEVQELTAQTPELTAGVFFVDLDSGAYVELEGTSTFPAASIIKVPVLVAFFQDVDAGKVRLDEMLAMRPDLVATGSGVMQYRTAGTKFTALETATKMIVISDNTATNMLIERLGGIASLNQRFKKWGLEATEIRNLLPDLEGTNTTRPKDLAHLMARISQGDLVSLRSRDRLLDIMRRTETDTLLPRGLGEEAMIAHKTGDIGSLVGDVGLIDVPNGKRYIGVAMVKRPHNDSRAQELIRQISRVTYKSFSQPTRLSPQPTPAVAGL